MATVDWIPILQYILASVGGGGSGNSILDSNSEILTSGGGGGSGN